MMEKMHEKSCQYVTRKKIHHDGLWKKMRARSNEKRTDGGERRYTTCGVT